jgi:DNA polymerase I-like protein with 3'-5' exonuclease and polymerase domains
LEERLYRDGLGKVGNFSIPYQASDTLLERMIEANTGIKPPEGTGQKMIEAHARRYPEATAFLKRMMATIEDPGYYRAISGRVRHFFYTNLGDLDGVSDYTREGILSPLKRQACNFPMQNLVADTAVRAMIRFIKERNDRHLNSRMMMSLYDAMTVIAPFDQVKETVEILRNSMTIWCPWTVHGRTFNFDVDTSVGFRWGVKATKEEKELLKKYL